MSVLNRLINVTKAAAHEALSKLEDPVMMLNHYLRDAAEEIESLQKELVKQTAAEKNWEFREAELLRLADAAEARAAEALNAGRESEARLALEAKLHYVGQARECAALRETAKTGVAELHRQLEEAKTEHTRMQAKRAELAARAQAAAAKARTAVHDFGSGFEGGAARGFRRMEEKIMEWEARAGLAGQRYSEGAAAGTPQEPYAPNQAAAAAHEARIDEELERLRKNGPNH